MKKSLCSLLFLVALPGVARAHERGYLEIGGGAALPVGAGAYTDHFSLGPSLWAAAVLNARQPPRFAWMTDMALEMAFDYTAIGDDYDTDDPTGQRTLDFDRYRVLLGARYHLDLREGLVAFARAAGGIDMMVWDEDGKASGLETGDSGEHLGVALELGGGVRYQVGPVDFGAQLAVPMALHQDETYGAGVEIDHFALDLEARVTVAVIY